MSIAPTEFLSVAAQLHNPSNEAANRSAASRAYYSVYHACADRYQEEKIPEGKPTGMHTRLINTLKNSPSQHDRRIGFILSNVYEHRIRADYKLTKDYRPEEAENAIKQSRRLLELLELSR